MNILDCMNCGELQKTFPFINCKFTGLDGKIDSQQISCLIFLVINWGVGPNCQHVSDTLYHWLTKVVHIHHTELIHCLFDYIQDNTYGVGLPFDVQREHNFKLHDNLMTSKVMIFIALIVIFISIHVQENILAQKLEMEVPFYCFQLMQHWNWNSWFNYMFYGQSSNWGRENKVSLLVVLCVQLFGSGFVFVVS